MKQANGQKWYQSYLTAIATGKMRFGSRTLAYALSTLMVAFMATACGNKDNGGGAAVVAVVPGYGASCASCGALSGLVASGLGLSYQGYSNAVQAQLSVQFYGDAASLTAATQAAGNMYYDGQIAVGGVMRVRLAKADPQGCQVPVGDYTIATTTPGVWQGEQFGNVVLTASGPVQLQIRANGFISGTSPARVDLAGATFPYAVRANFYVLSSSAGGYCSAGGYPEYIFK